MTVTREFLKNGYVLVVDDMPNIRRTIKNMLRQLGITDVKEADDGDTAMRLLKVAPDVCKFVFLDWNMPRMPGIEVAREIRADEKFQDLPILMITAEIYKDQIMEAGEIGINGYILKPFNARTLNDKILNIMAGRTNPPPHVKLIKAGETLVEQGEYDMALDIFQRALKLNESARVLVHIGETSEKKGELEKASAYYKKAADKNPDYLKAHVVAAELHMKMGNENAALASLEKAGEISPNNTDRQVSIGEIYLKKGDEEKAEKAFNAAIKKDPQKSQEVAEVYLDREKPELAEKFFRKSLESHAKDVHVYNRLGIALRKQGKWQDAVKEYRLALKVDPEDEAIYFNMGRAYLEGRKNEDARGCFLTVLKINPELNEARKELKKIG
jgi:tetratricopeptide (TPR) repeat protein